MANIHFTPRAPPRMRASQIHFRLSAIRREEIVVCICLLRLPDAIHRDDLYLAISCSNGMEFMNYSCDCGRRNLIRK